MTLPLGYYIKKIDSCANCKKKGEIPWNNVIYCSITDEHEYNSIVEPNGFCDKWEVKPE
jgi:hypothetical protein